MSRVLVSALSGHVKGVSVSRYLPQGDDVGLSEGVSILLGELCQEVSERESLYITSHEVDLCGLSVYKCERACHITGQGSI